MAIDLASASAELRLDVTNFVTNAQRAADAAQGIQQATDNVTSGGFLGWVTDNEAALNRWGKGMLAVGGIITGAFAAPIIAGSRAAWGQVDAVQQSTIAMSAYADSAEEVDAVLASLIAYARSDLGVLFQREDLFASAQSMLIYGAAIEDVTGYTEILSRSVGLGLSDWDSLNTIVGRVGATGRLTGNDFDMLTARGYALDESIRNTDMSWEELMGHLDKGIPADALAGQADTIRGKSIRLQSALRGLGLAFLGVDSETSKFIEGGLGWQMMRGMERLTDLMKRAAPAVQGFGNVIAAIGKPIGTLFDLLLKLPQPVQTAMLMFTGFAGVATMAAGGILLLLPQIAALPAALSTMATAASAARTAMVGLFMNPAMLAAAAFFGTLILMYQTNFLGFADAVDHAWGRVSGFFADFFGAPDQKNVTLDIDSLADTGFYDWQQMPDGSYKHSELDITATGDTGVVSWVSDPNSPDGKAWTLTVDVDGDGKDDALTIISSEKLPDGTFTMTVTDVNDSEYMIWYDEKSDQAIIVPVELNTGEAMSKWDLFRLAMEDRIGNGIQAIQIKWDEFTSAIVNSIPYWHEIRDVIDTIIEGLGLAVSAAGNLWDAITGDNSGPDYADTVDTDMGPQPTMGGVTRTPRQSGSQSTQFDIDNSPAFAGLRNMRGLGSYFRDAADAAGLFGGAINTLNPALMRSDESLNSVASTIPMYTGATQEASGATGAMAGSMGGSFGSIAASALANFGAMQSEASGKTAAMNSLVASQTSSMQSSVAGHMMGMRTSATVQTALMQTNATNSASTMASQVGGHVLGMRTASALQMGLMASGAATTGSQMNTGLTGWMVGAHAAMVMRLGLMVGAVRNTGSTGYDAGYYAGSMISLGFANGMSAYLGQIRASANAMVAAASAAVIAKAMISSPSRLFMQYGEYIGEGLEIGMRSMLPAIGRTADQMLDTGIPALNTPIGSGGYGGTTVINNHYHQTDVKVMTSAEWEAYKQKSERGNAAYGHLNDPDSYNYGGGI